MDEDACVMDCTECPELVESRTQIVNGFGPNDADIMLVGEAPGANEDEEGEPFVGRSGSVLDDALEDYGLTRDDVRITNTVRCRPPDNRDPRQQERRNCQSHLEQEIAAVEPKAILSLGSVPASVLIGESVAVTKVSGNTYDRTFEGFNTTVIAGLHPAATLYDPSYADLFEDALQIAISFR